MGVYWQQYGWISPGEEISGLEDEYCLAPRDMPKLIYVKQPAERDERLADLMTRIRDDDSASYTPFSTAEELCELVGGDLATLLAERFDASRRKPATGSDGVPDAAADVPAVAGRIPAPTTDAVGRESAIATLLDWLGWDEKRLVTLVGPGGIGKTRLAVEVARLAQDRFDRVTFVRLAEVREAADVLPDDRPRPRRARHGRPPPRPADRVGARRPPRPHRARQLRAGAPGRHRCPRPDEGTPRRDVPRDEPRPVARAE